MKKVSIEKRKLSLNKTKITNLSSAEMSEIQGGFTRALHTSIICNSGHQTCCSNADGSRCNYFVAELAPVQANAVNLKGFELRIP